MPRKGTVDAILIVREMQEEYQSKQKKLYMCFVDMEKAFNRVSRKAIDWAMRKKGLFKVMNGSGNYELVCWCKDKSENGICIFREIQT